MTCRNVNDMPHAYIAVSHVLLLLHIRHCSQAAWWCPAASVPLVMSLARCMLLIHSTFVLVA